MDPLIWYLWGIANLLFLCYILFYPFKIRLKSSSNFAKKFGVASIKNKSILRQKRNTGNSSKTIYNHV